MTEETIPLETRLKREQNKSYRLQVQVKSSEAVVRTLMHKLNKMQGVNGLSIDQTLAQLRMLRAQVELKDKEILRLNNALDTLNSLVPQIVEDNRRMKKVTEHFGHKKTRK